MATSTPWYIVDTKKPSSGNDGFSSNKNPSSILGLVEQGAAQAKINTGGGVSTRFSGGGGGGSASRTLEAVEEGAKSVNNVVAPVSVPEETTPFKMSYPSSKAVTAFEDLSGLSTAKNKAALAENTTYIGSPSEANLIKQQKIANIWGEYYTTQGGVMNKTSSEYASAIAGGLASGKIANVSGQLIVSDTALFGTLTSLGAKAKSASKFGDYVYENYVLPSQKKVSSAYEDVLLYQSEKIATTPATPLIGGLFSSGIKRQYDITATPDWREDINILTPTKKIAGVQLYGYTSQRRDLLGVSFRKEAQDILTQSRSEIGSSGLYTQEQLDSLSKSFYNLGTKYRGESAWRVEAPVVAVGGAVSLVGLVGLGAATGAGVTAASLVIPSTKIGAAAITLAAPYVSSATSFVAGSGFMIPPLALAGVQEKSTYEFSKEIVSNYKVSPKLALYQAGVTVGGTALAIGSFSYGYGVGAKAVLSSGVTTIENIELSLRPAEIGNLEGTQGFEYLAKGNIKTEYNIFGKQIIKNFPVEFPSGQFLAKNIPIKKAYGYGEITFSRGDTSLTIPIKEITRSASYSSDYSITSKGFLKQQSIGISEAIGNKNLAFSFNSKSITSIGKGGSLQELYSPFGSLKLLGELELQGGAIKEVYGGGFYMQTKGGFYSVPIKVDYFPKGGIAPEGIGGAGIKTILKIETVGGSKAGLSAVSQVVNKISSQGVSSFVSSGVKIDTKLFPALGGAGSQSFLESISDTKSESLSIFGALQPPKVRTEEKTKTSILVNTRLLTGLSSKTNLASGSSLISIASTNQFQEQGLKSLQKQMQLQKQEFKMPSPIAPSNISFPAIAPPIIPFSIEPPRLYGGKKSLFKSFKMKTGYEPSLGGVLFKKYSFKVPKGINVGLMPVRPMIESSRKNKNIFGLSSKWGF